MTVIKTLLIEIDMPEIKDVDTAEECASNMLEKFFRKELCVMSPAFVKITIGSGQHGVSDIVVR